MNTHEDDTPEQRAYWAGVAEGRSLGAARIATLEAEVARLRSLLDQYGQHRLGCCAYYNNVNACECGWSEEKENSCNIN